MANENNKSHIPSKDVSDDDRHKTEKLTGSKAGGTDMSTDDEGEDDGSAPVEGEEDHLTEDQKPL